MEPCWAPRISKPLSSAATAVPPGRFLMSSPNMRGASRNAPWVRRRRSIASWAPPRISCSSIDSSRCRLVTFNKDRSSTPSVWPQRSLRDSRAVTRSSCRACTIGCTHMYALRDQEGRPVRLEYENLFALGPLCAVDDPEIVLQASQRCDELGMDVISAGATIAFAMECVERGLLDAPWLRFGDGDAMLRAIELIGSREGLGDLLANGSRQSGGNDWRRLSRLRPACEGVGDSRLRTSSPPDDGLGLRRRRGEPTTIAATLMRPTSLTKSIAAACKLAAWNWRSNPRTARQSWTP